MCLCMYVYVRQDKKHMYSAPMHIIINEHDDRKAHAECLNWPTLTSADRSGPRESWPGISQTAEIVQLREL